MRGPGPETATAYAHISRAAASAKDPAIEDILWFAGQLAQAQRLPVGVHTRPGNGDAGASAVDRRAQWLARIITVRTGEAGDGWLCPMSSYPHDL